MTNQQEAPEALRLADEAWNFDCSKYRGVRSANAAMMGKLQDCADMIRKLHTENTMLQAGYAAARLEIESLQARIKTMAEDHADELMVAHLDGRARAAQVMFNGLAEEETMKTASCAGLMTQPASEYPAAPEGVAFIVEYGGDVFTLDQMRAYVDADRAMRAAQPAGAQQPDTAYADLMQAASDWICEHVENGTPSVMTWAIRLQSAAQKLRASHGQAPAQAAPAAVAVPTFEDFCKRHGLDPKKMDGHGGMWARVALDECRATAQPAPQQEAQEVKEPVAWYVTGCGRLLDEDEAKAEARHIGGTARAIPLYTAPQPAPAPLSDDVVRDAARYRWLRDTSNADDHAHMIALHIRDEQNDASLSGIDAAIDAAIAAQGGK